MVWPKSAVDFVAMPFEAKLRRGAGKIQLQMTREGNAWGIPLKLTKAITMEEGDPPLVRGLLDRRCTARSPNSFGSRMELRRYAFGRR